MKSKRLRAFDRRLLEGVYGIVGIDEAGRGALAGPVVASAVAVRKSFYDTNWCRRNASKINDSKLLSPEERESIYERLRWLESEGRVSIGVGRGSVDEIESLNILGATQVAMRRALEEVFDKTGLEPHDPDPLFAVVEEAPPARDLLSRWRVIVDGRPLSALGYAHEAFVSGDSRSLCIAMASVVAKVTRDRLMLALDSEFPHYDLASSKGYATQAHRRALLGQGSTVAHRKLFLRKILDGQDDADVQREFSF